MATTIIPKLTPEQKAEAPMGYDRHGVPRAVAPPQPETFTLLPTLGPKVCSLIEKHIIPGAKLDDETRVFVSQAFDYAPGNILANSAPRV
jgi:hypothetical protein